MTSINKANLITGYNNKSFLLNYEYSNNLTVLLNNKLILVSSLTCNIFGNVLFIDLFVFFKSKKINKYKKKFKEIKYSNYKNNFKKFQFINTLYYNSIKTIGTNTLRLKIINLNRHMDENLLKPINILLAKYTKKIFERRIDLMVDFVKCVYLLSNAQISINLFLKLMCEIFKTLYKKRHNFFLKMTKDVFDYLIKNKKKNRNNSYLRGIKLLINGKIKGSLKTKSSIIQSGIISIHNTLTKTNLSKKRAYTYYGIYGFKIWLTYIN